MQARFQFTKSSGEVELRGTYVYAAARGVLATPFEVQEYFFLLQQHLEKNNVRRVLIDARGQSEPASAEVRTAAWDRLTKLGVDRIAYVVGNDEALKAIRVNMTAISSHVPIRAFGSVLDAHRWLSGSGTTPKAH